MNYVVLLACSLLVVVMALALAREVRLRRALQRLLMKFLDFWRNRHGEKEDLDRRGDDGDGPAVDQRLR